MKTRSYAERISTLPVEGDVLSYEKGLATWTLSKGETPGRYHGHAAIGREDGTVLVLGVWHEGSVCGAKVLLAKTPEDFVPVHTPGLFWD